MPVRPARFDAWLETHFAPYDGVASPWDRFPPGGDEPIPQFEGSDAEIVELFTYTMLSSGDELRRFTDFQVGNGLNVLFSGNFCDIPHTIRNGSVPFEQKLAAVQSIQSLYSDCLTPRAPAVLGKRSEPGDCPPLSFICYMLWDVTPLAYWKDTPRADEMYRATVDVMAFALLSTNVAVIESGLHGLGHTVYNFKEPAVAAIDRFLEKRRGHVSEELISYALQARTGMIQ